MDDLRKQELLELKDFFVSRGWIDGLFQILYVLEDVKPGMYLQQDNDKTGIKELKNILSWFELLISTRHGGYATKNGVLYKKWNRIFGFKMDAHEFLGYPKCCTSDVVGFGSNLILFELYSLFKGIRQGTKNINELKEFLRKSRFLHHTSCSIRCRYSKTLETDFEKVITKYNWLVKELIEPHIKREALGFLQLINQFKDYTEKAAIYDIAEARERGIIQRIASNEQDILEIAINKDVSMRNIKFGVKLIEANWICMLEGL